MDKEESAQGVDLGQLGSFDFTPDWVKKGVGVSVDKRHSDRESESGNRERRPFGERRGGTGGDRKPFGERRDGFGPRKPFGDRKPSGARDRFAERPKPLELDVKVLPETKALGTIIRKLQMDAHAYKLKDLAYFFLDNPSSVLLRVTAKANPEKPGEKVRFYQCKACGFTSTNRDDVLAHAVAAHLGDYYDAKEIEVEPPKGNFNCVAKCGLSGVLLGPPNIHEFGATVREMIRTRYPGMSEQEYRSHLEMVRTPEAIEEWRKGAVKRTVFLAKGVTDDAQAVSREQAEGEFRRTILATLVDEPKTLLITADVAATSPVKDLVWAVRRALEGEHALREMCFALRGAFHHRKLKFFRVNDAHGQEFVTNVEYKEFDALHAIPELANVAAFIAANPCATKAEICTADETEQHLNWLVSTGHVVSFTNGVYSAVEKFPKYGPQWQKKRPGKAPAEETPAAEREKAGEPKAAEPVPAEPAAVEPVAEMPAEPAAPVEEPVAAPVAESAAPEAAKDGEVAEEKSE